MWACVLVSQFRGFPLDGSDVAAGKVLVPPEVVPVPIRQLPGELAVTFPKVPAASAAAPSRSPENEAGIDLSDAFVCRPDGDAGSSR